MVKENENTVITEKDLEFIQKQLSKTNKPLSFEELTQKLAYKKTSSQLQQEVKKYNPYCKYEVGDLIYKQYDEPLIVSSKGTQHFKGAVVLKVKQKIKYENFNSEMLEVDYSGGGAFRKYMDYMKKTNTQVLLPSNLEGKGLSPQIIKKEEDPRQNAIPLSDKDLKSLNRNLKSTLTKSDKFFKWEAYIQLKEKKKGIPDDKIKEIENYLHQTKKSASTEELINQVFHVQPNEDVFGLYCMSLNCVLKKKYRKNFIYVSPQGWGRWHLKKILESYLQNLPLSAPKAKVPPEAKEIKAEASHHQKFPWKTYLTWREILSGGVKILPSLKKNLTSSREYTFTDVESGENYTVYFYPSRCFFLGLQEFFQKHNIPQGTSLTLDQKDLTHFNFWFKKSKKKISFSQVKYNPNQDMFSLTGEEAFTLATPNKIIHLETEFLKKITSLYNKRENLDLRELLILVFKHFGLEGENLALHHLRAYHLVDILKHTSLEDVEKTLLNSTEFEKSEKKKALFFYKEKIKTEEEIKPEKTEEAPPKPSREEEKEERPAAQEELPEIGTIEEKLPPKEREIRAEATQKQMREEPQPEKKPPPFPAEEIKEAPEEREEKAPPPQEKPSRKKKKPLKEMPQTPRKGKGEKRHIEEQIEMEESEQEAYYAVKSEQLEEEEKVPPSQEKKKKKTAYQPYSEQPTFGIFAEKLKSALNQKEDNKEENVQKKSSSGQKKKKENTSKEKNR